MKRFTTPGLLMFSLLGAVIGAQLWQRRKLKRIARRLEYEGRLLHIAIRITDDIRGSVDIARILETTALGVSRALDIEHCCIRFDGDNRKESAFACSCGERDHDPDSAAAFASARNALGDEGTDRFLNHKYPNRSDFDSGLRTFPVLGIPIIRDGDRLAGALLVLSHDPARLWLESEIQLLLAVAHQLSLSVDHARLFATKERESFTDPLTSCLNRRGFDTQFESYFQAANERNVPLSLIMIDLDLFKTINDEHGHPVGDNVLRIVAAILLNETVEGAFAARVGGEEFALILPDHSVEQAVVVAERVRTQVELLTAPDLVGSVTVSCGVASFPLHALSHDSLYAMADKALIRAKTSGRNRVCVF